MARSLWRIRHGIRVQGIGCKFCASDLDLRRSEFEQGPGDANLTGERILVHQPQVVPDFGQVWRCRPSLSVLGQNGSVAAEVGQSRVILSDPDFISIQSSNRAALVVPF